MKPMDFYPTGIKKVINDCKASTWILTDEHLETTPKKLVEFSCSRRTTIIHAKL
jgi:hypothetical protein